MIMTMITVGRLEVQYGTLSVGVVDAHERVRRAINI